MAIVRFGPTMLVILAASGCAGTGDCGPYWPEAGATYVYGYEYDGEPLTYTTFRPFDSIPGRWVQVEQYEDVAYDYIYRMEYQCDRGEIRVLSDLYFVGDASRGWQLVIEHLYDPSWYLRPTHPRVGDTWVQTGTFEEWVDGEYRGESTPAVVTVADRIEEVTVPSGTWRALVLETDIPSQSPSLQEEWLVRGVGLVQAGGVYRLVEIVPAE